MLVAMAGPATVIAVVDDEESIRETLGFALRRAGYQVETYPDGQAAWDAFQRALPDLVVLDIVMPRLDGLDLCRRLRARSRSRHTLTRMRPNQASSFDGSRSVSQRRHASSNASWVASWAASASPRMTAASR